ncbi:hypothetical protein ACFY0N_06335 [Streptomyces vinaceus]|uniref:hypothetical protein n=1 Tax=Streptomyces vinaceus TaxID=1960 RepID=UPI0036A1CAB1
MRLLPSGRRERSGRGRGRTIAAAGTLLLALLTSLTGPTPANALATPSAVIGPTADHPKGAAAGPQAMPEPDPKAEKEAAVRALQQRDLSDACPAAIAPHAVVACTVDPLTTASFSLTLPRQKDLVLLQVITTKWAVISLVAPDGTAVTCANIDRSFGMLRCPTSQAGTYTVQVRDRSDSANDASVSYVPLLSSTGCKTIGPDDYRLSAPSMFHGSLPTGSAGDCYTVDMAEGEVLRTYSPTFEVRHSVYDASGKEICPAGRKTLAMDCKLTGIAPFRVSALQIAGNALAYDYSAAKLSRPEGCGRVVPQAFGETPQQNRTDRCLILQVSEAAEFTFRTVSSIGSQPSTSVLATASGDRLSECSDLTCDLPPGDYTWSADPTEPAFDPFGMAFYSSKESRGCTPTHDNGLVAGPTTGTSGGPGQVLCRTLPTPTGTGLYLLDSPPPGGGYVGARVYDATGVLQCEGYSICKLTGTAPFHAVLRTTDPFKSFAVAFHRTGDLAGCTPWPQSTFGNSTWGVEVSVAYQRATACLAVPGNAHSTAELLDFADSLVDVKATFRVVDAAGNVKCENPYGSRAAVCSLASGEPYTVLLASTAVTWGGTETYRLVRRDVSATASCAPAPSTKTGGPSLSFDLTAPLDSRCVRVAASTTDRFWFATRTPDVRNSTDAPLTVIDGDGRLVCLEVREPCRTGGSTSYTLVVGPSKGRPLPVTAKLDTWKLGTASGWAPECTANQVSASDFPQRSGTLSEAATAYCAVIDTRPGLRITVSGTTSAPDWDKPRLHLIGGANWAAPNSGYGCHPLDRGYGFSCNASNLDTKAGQAILLLSPEMAQTPVDFSLQGTCEESCFPPPAPVPTGISPSTSVAGTRTEARVTGTGLTFGTKLKLVRNGSPDRALEPVTANTDGSSLHVIVDTTGVEPGQYDLVVDGVEYTGGVPSPGYLPKAYTVTAPAPVQTGSRFVPAGPSRFLDTRDGTGGKKQRVGPGGVVTLQVAGVKGIPTTGITAVVMNVTAVNPTEAGHVTVYPNGQAAPGVSNLNFTAGQIVPNLVTVPVLNGKVDLRNNSGSVDLIADITGYYTDQAGVGSALNSITPSRFLDTRDGTGGKKQRVGPGGVVTLQVAGVKGIPTTGITAVVMNVTAVNPTEAGHVSVYPNGQAAPGVSNLNFTAGQIVPNLVTVPVLNGKVDLRNNSGSVDLIADITGYYAATGSAFSAAGPVRLLDTRDGTGGRAGAVGPAGLVSLQVAGVAGVPAKGVTAVVLNVTVTNPTEAGHLIVHPHGVARPNVSNLNYTPGQTVANLVVVPVVDGRVVFFNNTGSVDVIADLNGYFTS